MKILFFASFILFCLFVKSTIQKQKRNDERKETEFWEKERKSNLTRKKSLENLPYISIPLDTFPTSILTHNDEIKEIIKTMERMSKSKILNLTGISNTDLKLKYGVANLTILTEYDQNYTLLVRSLQKWAQILIENSYIKEARILLEYAISIRTDVSASYYALAKIYKDSYESYKIKNLIETASSLNSLMKNSIVRTLQEFDQSSY